MSNGKLRSLLAVVLIELTSAGRLKNM